MTPIENIIQQVKEEIARLSQALRSLEGTRRTRKKPGGSCRFFKWVVMNGFRDLAAMSKALHKPWSSRIHRADKWHRRSAPVALVFLSSPPLNFDLDVADS